MAPEKPERDGVEVALEGRVAAWQAVLDAYRAAKATDGSLGDASLGSGLQTTALKGAPLGSFDLPIGALRTKSVPDAIRLYLSAARRKQTNKEIAAGLRQGGLETTAGNFEANIAAALFRLRKAGVVLRFKDGWDLAEHYPDHIRNKLENGAKPKRAAVTARKKKAGIARKKQPKAVRAKAQAPKPGLTIDERVMAFLKAHPGQRFATKQVGEAIKESNPKIVGMAFARLTRFGRVSKGEDGLYASRSVAEHLKAV